MIIKRRKPGKGRVFFESITRSPDWWVAGIVIFLTVFGMLMIYEASAVTAARNFGDRFHFLREQFKLAILGGLSMGICAIIPYKKFHAFALPALVLSIVSLFAVFIPGIGAEILGAKRWLTFSAFTIQPAEFVKLSLIIYLAAWFSSKERGRLSSFLLLLGVVVGLVAAEPDLGTAIVILTISAILYFVSKAPLRHFAFFLPVVIGLGLSLSIIAPYRFNRVLTFFNPGVDPLGRSYHIRQILISLGSGGWFGVGLGKSLQKYEYVPEVTTDSIFAIIGEELGFVGATLLVSCFAILILRGYRIAAAAPDLFGRYLAVGIVSWIAAQTVINLSTMVALLPLTGIPLPFISYGGSSLVSMLAGTGILLNISRSGK